MKKYLLEKSRIVSQAKHERNYHVFYQLLAGSTQAEKEEFNLATPDDYYYLNQVWKFSKQWPSWNLIVQRQHWRHQNNVFDVVLVSLFWTLNRFHAFFCFLCWLWTSKFQLGKFRNGLEYFISGILLVWECGFKWYILIDVSFHAIRVKHYFRLYSNSMYIAKWRLMSWKANKDEKIKSENFMDSQC